ncbi:amidohydrolase family protein [Paenibacillus sp. ATY16]|uniref:amidohydrolase family protein n=1 Tax=Paenibacillus sp. ATY16 TaxID=1759312 RepID=UPI00200D5465|nr:amidohydrolase family protein [Paenibacillus sp. ATY16]MCK9857463.1 amidohydrolase [Paenibacillus sp. ATY16]
MIIDVHAHMGWDQVFDEDFTFEELLEKHDIYGIATTIVQPATCHDLDTVRAQHDAIGELSKRYPGQFLGMANLNPHLPDKVYEAEVRRCMEEHGFAGIKAHTFAHAVHSGSRDGRKVFGLASKLGVPVMVHTGAGIPFANPANLIGVAQDYPELPIVMAHCGMMIMAGETEIAMKACSNLYADITWTAGFNLRHWSHQFGADRFMFGTDHADNTGTELAKVRSCGLSQEDQDWILHGTAKKIYKL